MSWNIKQAFKPLATVVFGDLRRMFGPLMVIGIAGALTGAAFLWAMNWLDGKLGPAAWENGPHVAVMVVVGLAVALIVELLGSPGNVELLVDNIHLLGGQKEIRDLRSLLPISLLCIGAGGAMGPEAPLVQTTGSIGSYLADRWKMTMPEKRVLTISGMAAGFTVLFGTPLGAAIFALEILHRKGMEYYEALLPAVLGSLCGYAVFVALQGRDITPVWSHFSEIKPLQLHAIDMLWALGAGVAGAAVAAVFTYMTLGLQWCFGRMPRFSRPVVGGLVLGLLAMASPFALTFGEKQLDYISVHGVSAVGGLTVGVVALAVVAKLIGTSVTVSSGWRGGFIIPLFFMGAALGQVVHWQFPQSNEVVLMAALMAAANTGVTKTPLGSTIVVSEMAGLQLLPTTLIAAVVALLLTSEVGLIESQRSRGEAGEHAGHETAPKV